MPFSILRPPLVGIGRTPIERAVLTTSGGLQTDATRLAATEGDGGDVGDGFGFWLDATNIVTQSIPGADATTGVTKAGDAGATLTLVTDATAPFQASQTEVWLLDNSAGATDATVDFAGNATAAAHTGSIWAKAISGSPTVSIEGGGTPTTITGTDSYARYSQSRTASSGDNLRITAPAGAVVRFTAAQLETGSIATPFIVTNGATASRTAGRVQMPVADLFTATQGAVVVRVVPGWSSTGEPGGGSGFEVIAEWGDSGSEVLALLYRESSNQLQFYRNPASTGTSPVTQAWAPVSGTPATTIASWTSTAIKASLDGAAFTSTANTSTDTIAATLMDIGTGPINGSPFAGRVLWFATFAGTLTDDDVARLDAIGDTVSGFDRVRQAVSARARLTSVWRARNGTFERLAA